MLFALRLGEREAAARELPAVVQITRGLPDVRSSRHFGVGVTAVGAAFGLKVGERSGALQGESGYFIIQSLQHKPADSTAWLAQRDVQRTQFRQAAMQARMQQYMEDVRAQAKIVDRRKDIFKSQAAADATTGSL